MKKVLKVMSLSVLLIVLMFIVNQKSEAVTLDMNYSVSNEESGKKSKKIKSGDEILVAITVNGEDNGKIMAMFGYLYYDKDVLELVPSSNEDNSADIQLGTGWSIGNLSLGNSVEGESDSKNQGIPKFLIYSNDKNREDTAVRVKFKVKDERKFKDTEIKIKEITLYDSEHREIKSNVEDSVLKMSSIKINTKSSMDRFAIIVTIISILIIIILVIFVMFINKKQKKTKEEISENTKLEKEDKSTENSKKEIIKPKNDNSKDINKKSNNNK